MKPLQTPRYDLEAGAAYRLLDGVSDAVVVFDGAARLLYVNAAAEQALGAAAGAPLSALGAALGDAALDWVRHTIDGAQHRAGATGSSREIRSTGGERASLKLIPLDPQRWALSVVPPSGLRPRGDAQHTSVAVVQPALQRRDDGLDEAAELAASGLAVFDASGTLLGANAAFAHLLGHRPSRLGELPDHVRRLLDEVRTDGGAGSVDLRVADVHGRLHRRRAGVHRGGDGGRFIVTLEDLSAADERDIARLQLAALVDTAGIGLATYHESLGWLRAAPDAHARQSQAQPLARSVDAVQAIGRDVVEASSLSDYERLQSALRQGERIEVRYAVRHPDVGVRWLMTRVEPGQLASGDRVTSVVTLDVTEHERASARSEQLLHELTTILESSNAGIAYLREGRLARCNPRFEHMFGVEPGTFSQAGLERLGATHAQARRRIDEALVALRDVPLYETEFFAQAQPAPRWYSLSVRRAGDGEAIALLTDITRLKAQQLEYEQAAHDRELMFNLSDVGIATLRAGRIERANAALTALTGFAAAELVGSRHERLFENGGEYARIAALQEGGLRSHDRWSGEHALRRRDGTLLWVQASLRLAEAGRPDAAVIASYVNVDERRRAQQLLARQAGHTRAILDSVLVGIVTVAGAGIEWMNRSARRMFGGELADFLGQPLSVVATPEPTHPFRLQDTTYGLADGQARTFECRIRARDGRQFWVAGNVVATSGESAQVQLTYALLDIDRRRQAEARSAQSQASLQRIIESAPLAISLCDARTSQVIQINQIAAATLGRSVADCLGRSIDELYTAESAQQRRTDMQAALAAGDVTRREYRTVDAQGERHWDARYLPLRTGTDAAPDQLLLVATDVTEQRAAERDRLAAALAQRDMLVKEVHHRIKNNLQGVAALLQQVAQRRPEVASAIQEAVGQVQAIANVYGLQVSPDRPVCARRVVEAIIASVQRHAARRIELVMAGDETLRWALPEAESIPIALCLNELLGNAIKHAEPGDIVCTLEMAPAQVRVAIANPGRLPQGFDLDRVRGGVYGLGLVRALLPRRSAALTLGHDDGLVVATVVLMAPVIVRLDAS